MTDKIHKIKTWPKYYNDVLLGAKTFEVRKNDRAYKVGEYITLEEWDNDNGIYTGRALSRRIKYILDGGQFGIKKGYIVMSLA